MSTELLEAPAAVSESAVSEAPAVNEIDVAGQIAELQAKVDRQAAEVDRQAAELATAKQQLAELLPKPGRAPGERRRFGRCHSFSESGAQKLEQMIRAWDADFRVPFDESSESKAPAAYFAGLAKLIIAAEATYAQNRFPKTYRFLLEICRPLLRRLIASKGFGFESANPAGLGNLVGHLVRSLDDSDDCDGFSTLQQRLLRDAVAALKQGLEGDTAQAEVLLSPVRTPPLP